MISGMEIKRHSAEIEGRGFHYQQAGSGPPLVLIHGLLGGSFCWRLNLPAFARRFTTYAVDLPGHGESDAPRDGNYGMEAQAGRLHFWLEKLGSGPVDVVAASWGGAVALFVAALNPKIVRSLVLAAPVNPWSNFGLERVRFFSSRLGAALLRLAMPISRPVHLTELKRMYGDPNRMPAGTLEGYSRFFLRKGLARNIVQTLRCWENDLEALPAAIQRVQSPTLLIWGTRDGAVDMRSADVLRQKLPKSELAIIQGAGHLPFEETPEQFNQLVMGFLERV